MLWGAAVLILWLPQRASTERGFEIGPRISSSATASS
jgi:hypothetical protein